MSSYEEIELHERYKRHTREYVEKHPECTPGELLKFVNHLTRDYDKDQLGIRRNELVDDLVYRSFPYVKPFKGTLPKVEYDPLGWKFTYVAKQNNGKEVVRGPFSQDIDQMTTHELRRLGRHLGLEHHNRPRREMIQAIASLVLNPNPSRV